VKSEEIAFLKNSVACGAKPTVRKQPQVSILNIGTDTFNLLNLGDVIAVHEAAYGPERPWPLAGRGLRHTYQSFRLVCGCADTTSGYLVFCRIRTAKAMDWLTTPD
jgi:hypothetical protein